MTLYWEAPTLQDDFLELIQEERARCRPTDEELIAGVPFIVGVVRCVRAETQDGGQIRLTMAELTGEQALQSPVDLTWRQQGTIREDRVTLRYALFLAGLAQFRDDIGLISPAASALPDGRRPVVWAAFASLVCFPPKPPETGENISGPLIATINAWDMRQASVAVLDPDFKDSLLEPLLRPNAQFAGRRQLIREARASMSEADVRAIAATASSEYFSNLPSDEPPLNGLFVTGSGPLQGGPSPDILEMRQPPKARWYAVQQRIAKELETEAFGSGINSSRSKKEQIPLEEARPGDLEFPEDHSDDSSAATERLDALRSILSPEELRLLDLLQESPSQGKPNLPAIARRHNLDLADVEAVFKRIRRKANKLG